MFVSTFGFYLKHEKLLKQSGELNCWQYNLLACLLIHFKNSFPVHYYSSPATLFHCQEKDTWQRVWDKVIYLGLGDETIAVQKMLILHTEFSFNFALFCYFFIFAVLGIESNILCYPRQVLCHWVTPLVSYSLCFVVLLLILSFLVLLLFWWLLFISDTSNFRLHSR